MNLVKAADDLKNLSDQQLMMAGQNPVVVPPYLVLAEMKRREQLRAEYAKSAQAQQQPTVMQQVTQNLVQQPQQQQPQQQQQPPQAQGIMQAAPPQVAAMAGGGHVARYANQGRVTTPSLIQQYQNEAARSMQELQNLSNAPVRMADTSMLGMDPNQIKGQFAPKPFEDYLSQLSQLQGETNYGSAENLVRQQMQQAQARRPRIGDALIAAGAAMASNRDNRVGLANLLAQAIGVGSQTYDTAKREQQKELNAAMMAQVALDKMKQEERQRRGAAAMQLAQFDQNKLLEAYKIAQQNQRTLIEERNKALREQDKRIIDAQIEKNKSNLDILKTTLGYKQHLDTLASNEATARIRASSGEGGQTKLGLSGLQDQQNSILKQLEATQKQMELLRPGTPEADILGKKYLSLEKELDMLRGVAIPTVLQQLKIPVVPRTTSPKK
jgi:hypothetical protein